MSKYKYIYCNNDIFTVDNTIDDDIITDITKFPIASISKFITVILILKLKINTDLTIGDYIKSPSIFIKNPQLKKTKIIDIIKHEAHIKSVFPFILPDVTTDFWLSDFMEDYLKKHKVFIKIKSLEYYYSTIGYIILGYLIEQITGESYFTNLKRIILDPFKMTHTTISNYDIKLYTNNFIKINDTLMKKLLIFGSSGGGLCSCVDDLKKFCENIGTLLSKSDIEFLYDNTIWFCKVHNNRGTCHSISNVLSVNGNFIGAKINISIDFDTNRYVINFKTCHTMPNLKSMLRK